jgi:uncharacterized protein with PIN domain
LPVFFHFQGEYPPAFPIPDIPVTICNIFDHRSSIKTFDLGSVMQYDKVMEEANFVFLGDLVEFLPLKQRCQEVHLVFEDHQTIKHLIESLGIPHVEVGEMVVNGSLVGPEYLPRTGDRIEIRPFTPGWEEEPRFLLDNHLGRLAAQLRMLGFDCLYRNDFEDAEMAELLWKDPRILLTRDRRLLMRKTIQFGYCVRSLDPDRQILELVERFDLARWARPFRRCIHCNALLEAVDKSAVIDRLEPKTKLYYNEFSICPNCSKIYWKGSHWERMRATVTDVLSTRPAVHE